MEQRWETRLSAAASLLPRVCLVRLEERLRSLVKASMPKTGGGGSGPSALCRVLRFASATTHWAVATTHRLVKARRLKHIAAFEKCMPRERVMSAIEQIPRVNDVIAAPIVPPRELAIQAELRRAFDLPDGEMVGSVWRDVETEMAELMGPMGALRLHE